MSNVSDNVVELIKTHFSVQQLFYPLQNPALWDNVENTVQPERAQLTTWRLRFSRWVPKATHFQNI